MSEGTSAEAGTPGKAPDPTTEGGTTGDAHEHDGAMDLPQRGQVTRRIYYLSLQAIFNAIVIGFIAKGMLFLIDFVTNIAFYGRISSVPVSPTLEHVGAWVLVIPIIGALLVGLMARYGSPNIRGHGFPETIEKILVYKSRIAPKITILKP
ncbi:MAG: hypothetical protein ABI373_02745, partial [Flavobacteriales bacterium]